MTFSREELAWIQTSLMFYSLQGHPNPNEKKEVGVIRDKIISHLLGDDPPITVRTVELVVQEAE